MAGCFRSDADAPISQLRVRRIKICVAKMCPFPLQQSALMALLGPFLHFARVQLLAL